MIEMYTMYPSQATLYYIVYVAQNECIRVIGRLSIPNVRHTKKLPMRRAWITAKYEYSDSRGWA